MKKISDGWHNFYGMDVYVEDGMVLRSADGRHVYRKSRYGGWDLEERISVDAFRAGWKRDTIALK